MPDFNKEQLEALHTSLDENVAISAGAGSGKTRTLTEKLFRLLKKSDENPHPIDPSELLVLTFTNNSAHDMKSKIVKKCSKDQELADKILSSHIQTFDSFSAYLVNKYSYKLGIADNIQVANAEVLNTKVLVILDEILAEYYASPIEYKKILLTLKKLSLHDDGPLKRIVLDLYARLDGMLEKEQKQYIHDASISFLSREHFFKLLDDYVAYYKNKIKEALTSAYFVYKYNDTLNAEEYDLESIKNVFYSKGYLDFLNYPLDAYDFGEEDIDKMYQILLRLLSLSTFNFIHEVKRIFKDYVEQEILFVNGKKIKYKGSLKEAALILSKCFATNDALLSPFKEIGTMDDVGNLSLDLDYLKIASFKDDIALFFEITTKLQERIFAYQKSTNSYNYQTISRLALKLLNDEEVATETREQFKYIMIDEYQDTNDLQETFINILLKPRKSDNKPATLFVVGDAKQSIYAFRNSNVELFKARLKDEKLKPHVIYMNKNYRSGATLLNDINYIFKHYMYLEHGGIDYASYGEALSYDYDTNLYSKDYPYFGVKRITSLMRKDYDGLDTIYRREIWEAYAIISDIKEKVSPTSKFTVSVRQDDGSNLIRKARYSDFAILVRKKSCFELYARLFSQYNIPLNIKFDEKLLEVDAILAIESLINLLAYVLGENEKLDLKHTFASLARSYLFNYSDQELFDVLVDNGEVITDLTKIYNTDLYKQVENFANTHQEDSFSKIFLDMLKEFKIIDNLYLIGKVTDNITKIESFYSIVLAEEASREGLKEFILLMKNISKYKLDLDSANEINSSNAVDLMTIHASKGLERKVIYLPNSYNSLAKGSNQNKPDYIFSKNNGVILPYYSYELKERGDGYFDYQESNYKTIYSRYEDLQEDRVSLDEHVRLFYVALTRAENTIYIVGDPLKMSNDKNKENLYGMLSYLPHYPLFNEMMEDDLSKYVSPSNLSLIKEIKNTIIENKKPLTKNDFDDEEAYKKYLDLYRNKYVAGLYAKLENLLEDIENQLFIAYYQEIEPLFDDIDVLSIIFAHLKLGTKASSFDELVSLLEDIGRQIDEENNEEDDDSESGDIFKHHFDYFGKEHIKEYLTTIFSSALKEKKSILLNGSLSGNKIKEGERLKKIYETDVPLELKNDLLMVFLKILRNIDYIYYWSYASDEYQDEIIPFDYHSFEMKNHIDKPIVEEVLTNDDEIIFNPRFKERASKTIKEEDNDLTLIFERGTYLHRLLELVDFKTKDTSFIENEKDRKLIDEVLRMPIFDEINKADKVYKEYGFYDERRGTNGFIDLFFISSINGENVYTILDYKTRHTEDDGYIRQLNIYKDNIVRIFHLDEEKTKFRLLLLSIEDKKLFEVK